MRRSFQFHCNCCELDLILYKGFEKKYNKESTNYYCFNCHKIAYHNQCVDCGEKLYYAVEIPKERKYSVLEEENSIDLKLECMRCKSKDTELTQIGEWEY
ncbi:MAG: hypothetical protein KAU62_14840 [Candidatus Heimdallarchaeota archaeon]|nr:hypothetical protein [Candidatus Heimdallarchaeota archaeon]MCK4612429.1 hypothetical protein [Candidatus Heimdallarchaeota archaeon]